jgi:hypothetical protein
MSPPIRGPEYPCPDLPAPSGGWWADDPVGHSTRNSARGAAPFHGPPKNGSLILTKQGTGCFGNGPNRPHAPAPLTGGDGFVPPNSPAVMSSPASPRQRQRWIRQIWAWDCPASNRPGNPINDANNAIKTWLPNWMRQTLAVPVLPGTTSTRRKASDLTQTLSVAAHTRMGMSENDGISSGS